MRAFLFCQLNEKSLDINVLGTIAEEKHPLRPGTLLGIFFEGLVCFQLARQSNNDERSEWMEEKGETVLEKMKLWSQHSTWNFENKMLLLEAEQMHTLGDLTVLHLFMRGLYDLLGNTSSYMRKPLQANLLASSILKEDFAKSPCVCFCTLSVATRHGVH